MPLRALILDLSCRARRQPPRSLKVGNQRREATPEHLVSMSLSCCTQVTRLRRLAPGIGELGATNDNFKVIRGAPKSWYDQRIRS